MPRGLPYPAQRRPLPGSGYCRRGGTSWFAVTRRRGEPPRGSERGVNEAASLRNMQNSLTTARKQFPSSSPHSRNKCLSEFPLVFYDVSARNRRGNFFLYFTISSQTQVPAPQLAPAPRPPARIHKLIVLSSSPISIQDPRRDGGE